MDRDEVLRRLREHGDRRQDHEAARDGELAEIARLARAARALGVPKTHISRQATISRPSLDDMLRR